MNLVKRYSMILSGLTAANSFIYISQA